MTRTSNNKNGRANEKPVTISFDRLEACPKVFLRNLSLQTDVDCLSDERVEEHREEFLFQYPWLDELVPDVKVMRRLMRFAAKAGKKHLSKMRSGRCMAPTSL